MHPTYLSISVFRDAKNVLCKREKNGYHTCASDICETFKDLSFDDIWEMNFLIRDLGNIRVIKVRIQNSHQNLSSADGFRLIIICNRKYNSITFLNIYPKRGKLAQMDQSPGEYKRQLQAYAEALKAGKLIRHDIDQRLKEIS